MTTQSIIASLKTPEVTSTNAIAAASMLAPWTLTDWTTAGKLLFTAILAAAILTYNVAKAIGAVIETRRLLAASKKTKSKKKGKHGQKS